MEHSLSLESFDRNSGGVESALKTDTVTVIVLPAAFFSEDVQTESIFSGEETEWTLPSI